MGVSCLAVFVFLMLFVNVGSFIFCFLFVIMPRRRDWARAHSLPKRVFANCLSWMTDVLVGSCVLDIIDFPYLMSWEGLILARAVTMTDTLSLRVVPALPMGMHTRSTRL